MRKKNLTKMNNRKMTRKARIGIAALAAIMALNCAAPIAASAAAPQEAETAVETEAEAPQETEVEAQVEIPQEAETTTEAAATEAATTEAATEAAAVKEEAATAEAKTAVQEEATAETAEAKEAETDVNAVQKNEAAAAKNAAVRKDRKAGLAANGDDKGDDDKDDGDPSINTTDITKWTISIIQGDDKMKTLLEASEKAIQGIVSKIPDVGYVAGPMLELVKILYESDKPETTLSTISKQLEGIQGQIEDAKKDVIEAMGTMSDMDKFVQQYNLFNSKYKEVSQQVSHISGYNMSQETKNLRLAEMVGEVSSWYSNDNLIFNHLALGNYLSGDTKLVSGQKDIYAAIMDHYSKIVLFGKEGMVKTEQLTADALAVYLESSTQLINCIIAKRNVLLQTDTEASRCDADYCKSKISEMLNQVIRVNEVLDAYKKENDPLTFYDHTGKVQKNIIRRSDRFQGTLGCTVRFHRRICKVQLPRKDCSGIPDLRGIQLLRQDLRNLPCGI